MCSTRGQSKSQDTAVEHSATVLQLALCRRTQKHSLEKEKEKKGKLNGESRSVSLEELHFLTLQPNLANCAIVSV